MDNTINKTRFVVFNKYDYYINGKKVKKEEFSGLTLKDDAQEALSATIVTSSLKNKLVWYDPLDEAQGLFTELVKIPSIWDDNYNVKGLIKFIDTFGLPMGSDMSEYRFERVLNCKMNFVEFNQQLQIFKDIFNTWIAITNKDPEGIKIHAAEYDLTYKLHFKGDPGPTKDIDKALYVLANKLNKQSKGNHTFTFSNGNPQMIYTFTDLFEVAYLQLSNFIENKGEFKACKNCGELFPVIHESRLYCHNLPGKSVSLCMDSYKQRRKRDKNKALELSHQGKDFNEILETINKKRDKLSKRTKQDVVDWINNI